MIDYKALKHSDSGMPTWDGFLYPVLKVAETKEVWKVKDLSNAVIKEINLPDELKNLTYPSRRHDRIIINRIQFAISDLKISGLLDYPQRGTYQISSLGKKFLKEYGSNITTQITHAQPDYIEYIKKKETGNSGSSQSEIDESFDTIFDLSENQIEDWFNKQNSDFSEQLLSKLRDVDPYKFEHMMVKLLSKMGYKGTNGQSLVTQKSNDGGIDGIINQDPLGLRTVYVQVKRYAENNVIGRPVIDEFFGALRRKHTDRGVFITTSSFSQGAKEAAKQLNIALVDGEMLTNLMIQYKVGIEVHQSYELYNIDDDFFE